MWGCIAAFDVVDGSWRDEGRLWPREPVPVQAPTKYEFLINLKTAKALRADVPPTLLVSELIKCNLPSERIKAP